ncbi:transcription factor IIA subunit alpha [Dispira parvispora]|uniref:Transcription initiation factor IIA large subunit n=1 Tax=Dispira parvispora TaxID=1520584 RepID=A0A9W8AT05_9FUNG|nr:transcription factor IIA subunit alpha [Dispira parvispora]
MASKNTGVIYQQVIDEVISAVQKEFEDHGVDEAVLHELQRLWETKLIDSHVADFPQVAGEEEYYEEAEPAIPYDQDYQPPPNPPQEDVYTTAAYTPTLGQMLPGGGPTVAANLASLANSSTHAPEEADRGIDSNFGRPQPYLYSHPGGGPPTVVNQVAASYPPTGTIVPGQSTANPQNPNAPNANPGNIPQHDGADDTLQSTILASESSPMTATLDKHALAQSQVDGDAGPTPAVEEDEDAINSDLDDSDDDEGNNDGTGEETEHIIICQYDKVTRQKNRWKCILRDGILLLDGKDYLFHKATAEFEW